MWLLASPCPIILLGEEEGGRRLFDDYLFMSEHTDAPAGLSPGSSSCCSAPSGHGGDTCVRRRGSHGERLRSSCSPAPSAAGRSKTEPRPAAFMFARHPTATAAGEGGEKSLLSHRRFLSPAPTPTPTPFRECGDQLPRLIALLAGGPFSKGLIRFLITTQCAMGFLILFF